MEYFRWLDISISVNDKPELLGDILINILPTRSGLYICHNSIPLLNLLE